MLWFPDSTTIAAYACDFAIEHNETIKYITMFKSISLRLNYPVEDYISYMRQGMPPGQ
jgi:hypothetical protein